MKKLSISLFVFICLFMTGCGEDRIRDVATLDEFHAIANSQRFSVSVNSKYDEVDYIIDSRVALYDGNGNGYSEDDSTDVLIEMIKYSDSKYAIQVQNSQIESFNLLKATAAYEDKEKGSNYYSYELVSNNRYMVSSRVDDTLIFCKTLITNKELVEEILDELDY